MKVWFFAAFLFLITSSTQAQDYERERRWAAEVVPNLVVGDAVRISGFLGIHTEARNPKAAILLVHGMGVHPDHGVIGILRGLLADAGYTTLSIQMPVQGAQATADDYPALFPEAAARIQAAAGWLAAKGHPRPVLLSHSMGSRMAMAYYERATSAPFAAWISLGITADYGATAKVGAPVLDVYGENDFPQVLRANPARRMAVSGIAGSKQVMIAGADHYYTGREKALVSAIHEFMGEQACRASGGAWGKFGVRAHLDGVYSCVPKTADGGKPCLNRNDCEYLCITTKAAAMGTAVTGECAAVRSPFGCNNHVDGGKIIGRVCVD